MIFDENQSREVLTIYPTGLKITILIYNQRLPDKQFTKEIVYQQNIDNLQICTHIFEDIF